MKPEDGRLKKLKQATVNRNQNEKWSAEKQVSEEEEKYGIQFSVEK